MDIQPVDVGDELRIAIQLRFRLSPLVLGLPVVRELLHRREVHALRCICDCLALGPPGGGDPPLEVRQIFIGRMEFEWPDRRVAARLCRGGGTDHRGVGHGRAADRTGRGCRRGRLGTPGHGPSRFGLGGGCRKDYANRPHQRRRREKAPAN